LKRKRDEPLLFFAFKFKLCRYTEAPPPNDVPLHYFGAGLKNVLSLLARVLLKQKWIVDVYPAPFIQFAHTHTPLLSLLVGAFIIRNYRIAVKSPLSFIESVRRAMTRAITIYRFVFFSMMHTHPWLVGDEAFIYSIPRGAPDFMVGRRRLTVSIPVLIAPWFQRLKLQYDEPLSSFAFKSNLHPRLYGRGALRRQLPGRARRGGGKET
jgi:hypothetical protein